MHGYAMDSRIRARMLVHRVCKFNKPKKVFVLGRKLRKNYWEIFLAVCFKQSAGPNHIKQSFFLYTGIIIKTLKMAYAFESFFPAMVRFPKLPLR